MLPVPVLDNQEYDEILDVAINTVVSRFPEWTDFNAHDPGITMLELFATIKESEQYMIDQISRDNRIKFLKLMGIDAPKLAFEKEAVKAYEIRLKEFENPATELN